MTLSKTVDGEKLTIAIIGTLDTATAPKLEEEVMVSTKGIHSLRAAGVCFFRGTSCSSESTENDEQAGRYDYRKRKRNH